jgi:hypothetical protein
MPNPAVQADIEARWRPLSDAERPAAAVRLDDAWWLLTGRAPSLEADMAAGTVATQNVVRVVADIATRVLRNPEGFEVESVDDWRGQRSALVASGVLHVTDEELAAVRPSSALGAAFTVIPYKPQPRCWY